MHTYVFMYDVYSLESITSEAGAMIHNGDLSTTFALKVGSRRGLRHDQRHILMPSREPSCIVATCRASFRTDTGSRPQLRHG